MKKLNVAFILLFNICFSQQKQVVKVDYSMTIADDNGVTNYNSVLYMNGKVSRFDFWLEKNKQNESRLDSENNYSIKINNLDTLTNSIFLDKASAKIYTAQENNPDISYYEELIPIDWQLSSEQKKIDRYLCNKAQAKFRGRNYTAYYTDEIPVSGGPFKFWGLPGLILEIYDSTNQIYFGVTKITIPFDADVSPPFNIDKIIKHRSEAIKESRDMIENKNKKLMDAKSRMESKNERNSGIKITSVKVTSSRGIELD